MKILHSILFLFFTQIIFGQTGVISKKYSPEKSVTVIYSQSSKSCPNKAFKIIGTTVQIDTCYDLKTKVFTIDKSESIKKNVLYAQIFNQTNPTWKKIETDINKVNCDYLLPFIIQVTENNKTETFSLKRIMGCYPSSAKQIMEGLDNYYSK